MIIPPSILRVVTRRPPNHVSDEMVRSAERASRLANGLILEYITGASLALLLWIVLGIFAFLSHGGDA